MSICGGAFFIYPTLINDFPSSLHSCGLSPEWKSKCEFSTRWISTFCTFVHFLPSVDIICVFRKTAWPNDFLQLEHLLALTPLWVSVRVYRVQSWANNIWQWSQVYAVLYCCGLQFASPDFLLYRMTSHILNKSSSMLLSIQAVSSLGLAWIGNTQLSTAPVCWTERSLSLNSAQTLKDFDLVALLNTTFC